MLLLSKILVPYDFSSFARNALIYALKLAQLYGAELHILHVEVMHEIPEFVSGTWSDKAEHFRTRVEEENDDAVTSLLKSTVVHYGVGQDIAPGPSVLKYASQYDIDLIIVGTHGRRGIRRMILGSVAEEIVKYSVCPVITIGRREHDAASFDNLKKILVPVDFSSHAEVALHYAKEIAEQTGAELCLLHVVPAQPYPVYTDSGGSSIYDFQPDLEKKALTHLDKLYKRVVGDEGAASYVVSMGLGAKEIVQQAEMMDCDLIVIGTHGLTGVNRFVLGSVTAKTVRNAQTPVFIVRSFGKSLLPEDVGKQLNTAV